MTGRGRTAGGGPDPRGLLFLGLAIFFFYGVLLWAPFIYDDLALIANNPSVAGPWTGARSLLNGGQGYDELAPLIVLLHRGLYALAGARPFLYRLTSLLLHWANACLVLALFTRDLRDRRLAFAGALLFALFPAHVEVLASSACKNHLLVSLFALSTLCLLDLRSWPAAARVGGCWLLFALALACKESAVLVPALAGARLLWEGRTAGRSRAETAALFGGWAALLAGYAVLHARFVPPVSPGWAGGSFGTNILTSTEIFAWCVRHLFWPWPLSLEHSLAPAVSLFGAGVFASACIAAAALGGLALLWRRGRRAWFAAAWTLLVLAPFLNLIPNPNQNYSLMSDRYLYLASAGFFLLLAVALDEALASKSGSRLRRWAVPALGAVALAYGAVGTRYAALYADPLDVWANAVSRAPANPRARASYGAALADAGQGEAAAAELRRAIELDPDNPGAYARLAEVESSLGRPEEAIAVFEAAVKRRPGALSWTMLGVYRLKAGRVKPAIDALLRAERFAPGDPKIRLDLGYAELAARSWGEAAASFREAARVPALRAGALAGWGEAARGAGRTAESAALLESALALNPWDGRAVELLADDDAALGRKGEAAALYDKLLAHLGGLTAAQAADPALAALRAELQKRRAALRR